MRTERKNINFIRNVLLRIHRDLFLIDRNIFLNCEVTRLTDFEVLVIALEDRRFFEHSGYDWKSLLREILKCLSFRKHGGASTIDMQFVRTCTGYKDLTLTRKLYEIFLSALIQYRYSKLEILRSYLGCAFFGSRLFGAYDASLSIFGKDLYSLNHHDAARLASMLVYPKPIKPKEGWGSKVEYRAAYGLKLLGPLKEKLKKLQS